MTPTMLHAWAMTAIACFVCGTSAASAHHSTNMFDSANPIELVGTVVEWQFANPHCVIVLEVVDENGDMTAWTLEGLSPNVLVRQGWRPDSLQPGDEIIASVRPLHSGAAGGSYRALRWSDGTPIDPTQERPD